MNAPAIDISGPRHDYHFPKNYGEFTRKHLAIFSAWISGQPADEARYLRFIVDFIGIPRKVWKKLDADQIFYFEVVDEQIKFMPDLDYLSKPYNNEKSLLRRIGLFWGPTDRLSNMSLEQVGFADNFSNSYSSEQTGKYLNLFFACAYQPFGLPFRPWLIDLYAFCARFARKDRKQTALRNYRGIHEAYRTIHPSVFKGKKVSKTAKFGYAGTIRKLAKTGIHGNEAQCKRVKYPDAMLTFDLNNIEIEEHEEEIRKKK